MDALKKKTVKELQKLLRDLHLPTKGRKAELIQRVFDATASKPAAKKPKKAHKNPPKQAAKPQQVKPKPKPKPKSKPKPAPLPAPVPATKETKEPQTEEIPTKATPEPKGAMEPAEAPRPVANGSEQVAAPLKKVAEEAPQRESSMEVETKAAKGIESAVESRELREEFREVESILKSVEKGAPDMRQSLVLARAVNKVCLLQSVHSAVWVNALSSTGMFEAVLNHVVANLHALCARSENGEKLSDAENAEFTSEIVYLRNCFKRIDVEFIRKSMMELVSFKLWRHLTQARLENEFLLTPPLKRFWTQMQEAKPPESLKNSVLIHLIVALIKDHSYEPLFSASLGLFIDLLSQFPTRRFVKSLIEDTHVVSRLKCAESVSPKLLSLVDVLEERLSCAVDEHKGREIEAERAVALVYAKVQLLQRVAFRHFENQLQDFALASVSTALDMLSTLEKVQAALEDMKLEELKQFLLLAGLIGDVGTGLIKGYTLEPTELNTKVLLQILVDNHRLRHSADGCCQFSFEKPGDAGTLPSMAGRFLSINDFTQRMYNLKTVELSELSVSKVKDAVGKLFPQPQVAGWSRMGTRLSGCRVQSVKKPISIDSLHEYESVRLEVQFSLDGTPKKVINEWDSLQDGDPLFLVRLTPDAMVSAVRLCEVDNSLISIPDNPHRTAILRLDVDQYAKDKANGVQYNAFSVLVRGNSDITRLKHEICFLHSSLQLEDGLLEKTFPSWFKRSFLGHVPAKWLGKIFGASSADLASNGVALLNITPGTLNPAYGIATILHPLISPTDESSRMLVVAESPKTLSIITQEICDKGLVSPGMIVDLSVTSSTHPFSKYQRVDFMLQRRLEVLRQCEALAVSLNLDEDAAYTSETTAHFFRLTVFPLVKAYRANPFGQFPFARFFQCAAQITAEQGEAFLRTLETMYGEIKSFRAFELLEDKEQRSDFVVSHYSKVLLCSADYLVEHFKALKARDIYVNNVVVLEATRMKEVQTFGALAFAGANLEKVVFVGDPWTQTPTTPISWISKALTLEGDSIHNRLIREGGHCEDIPAVAQTSMLGVVSLMSNLSGPKRHYFNPGFLSIWQCVDVPQYQGVGQQEPIPGVFNNLGEAEYIVAVYQYMRVLGYNSQSISIVTPHNGQKHLIMDVLRTRCKHLGYPREVALLDAFQGWQNEFVLVSLVRSAGDFSQDSNVTDPRKLVSLFAGAQRGIYLFGSAKYFLSVGIACWQTLWNLSPDRDLQLYLGERQPDTTRKFKTGNVLPIKSAQDMMAVTSRLLSHAT